MGRHGPIPKRSEQRRRRNAPALPIEQAPGAETVTVPPADPDWHPIARGWYESLEQSGQSVYYEPSDWATAYLIAESMSRDLGPQVVAVTQSGRVLRATIPLKGASLAAYTKAMTGLLVTEADRRRTQLELTRPAAWDAQEAQAEATVTDIRARLEQASGIAPPRTK